MTDIYGKGPPQPSITMGQAKTLNTPNGRWGIYDTVDGLWVGNDDGALRYDDEIVARLVAETVSRMMKWPLTRARATVFEATNLHIHDHLDAEVPRNQAFKEMIEDIEEGSIDRNHRDNLAGRPHRKR